MFQCPYSSCGAIFDDSGIRDNLMRFKQGQCPRCVKEISVDFDLSKYGSAPVPEVIEEILEDIPESELVSETIETKEENWEDCTMSELKKALKKRGLSTKGKKATLLKRLEEKE